MATLEILWSNDAVVSHDLEVQVLIWQTLLSLVRDDIKLNGFHGRFCSGGDDATLAGCWKWGLPR